MCGIRSPRWPTAIASTVYFLMPASRNLLMLLSLLSRRIHHSMYSSKYFNVVPLLSIKGVSCQASNCDTESYIRCILLHITRFSKTRTLCTVKYLLLCDRLLECAIFCCRMKEKMKIKRQDKIVDERLLFHGTGDDNLSAICQQG